MSRELQYTKRSGTRELGSERIVKSPTLKEVRSLVIDTSIQIPSAYKKEDGMLSYSLICVISGGTKRERVFLNELCRKKTFKTVDVIFVSTKDGAGGLTPKMMQSAYQELFTQDTIKVSGRVIKLDSVDMIYMFTDVDHYEDELKEILQDNNCSNPVWIVSKV